MVSEGTQSSTAILSQSDGVLLQDLPFSVELKKFIVEHYSTGMPKLFASEVIIHDKATGEAVPARIEVNHPASYKGVEIYQSSFDDGGSAGVAAGAAARGGARRLSRCKAPSAPAPAWPRGRGRSARWSSPAAHDQRGELWQQRRGFRGRRSQGGFAPIH